jgi:hypothetical protein
MLSRYNPTDPDALLVETHAAQLLNLSARTLQAWRLTSRGPAFVRAVVRSAIAGETFSHGLMRIPCLRQAPEAMSHTRGALGDRWSRSCLWRWD